MSDKIERSPLTCSSEELFTVVSSRNRTWMMLCLSNPAITEDHVIALMRNPTITPEIIHSVYERFDWSSSYKVQFAMVNCPKTPYTLAMRLLQMLFWNDLMKTVANYRISPRLRRAAENQLRGKIADLTLGEKMNLARTGPRGVVPFLRTMQEKQVVLELLKNPNLVEDDLLVMINNDQTPPYILAAIGSDHKWSMRYPIRLALVRNQNTPLAVILSFLSSLRKPDLEAVAKAPQTSDFLRRTTNRILSGNY